MKRIDEIAAMVRKGMVTADIGTDHAFLPILLVKRKIAPRAYACDITEGPLSAARRNIAAENLEDSIITILSDGFDNVPPDAECAVIAGMGCRTVIGILERAGGRIEKFQQIVVEANNETELLRAWISERGYTIRDEKVIRDRKHDYVAVSFDCTPHSAYTEKEQFLGPVLMERKDEAFRAYCRRMADKLTMILSHREDPVLRQRRAWYEEYA